MALQMVRERYWAGSGREQRNNLWLRWIHKPHMCDAFSCTMVPSPCLSSLAGPPLIINDTVRLHIALPPWLAAVLHEDAIGLKKIRSDSGAPCQLPWHQSRQAAYRLPFSMLNSADLPRRGKRKRCNHKWHKTILWSSNLGKIWDSWTSLLTGGLLRAFSM